MAGAAFRGAGGPGTTRFCDSFRLLRAIHCPGHDNPRAAARSARLPRDKARSSSAKCSQKSHFSGMVAGGSAAGMMAGRGYRVRKLISLIQRVSEASVTVDGEVTGRIGPGILVLLAVQPDDTPATVSRMAERVLTYRVFPDDEGRMNRSLIDVSLALLVVPQFTLAADTRKGTRASFTRAAQAEKANEYFELFVKACKERLARVETGVFGADMKVALVNDGPVTFWLEA